MAVILKIQNGRHRLRRKNGNIGFWIKHRYQSFQKCIVCNFPYKYERKYRYGHSEPDYVEKRCPPGQIKQIQQPTTHTFMALRSPRPDADDY